MGAAGPPSKTAPARAAERPLQQQVHLPAPLASEARNERNVELALHSARLQLRVEAERARTEQLGSALQHSYADALSKAEAAFKVREREVERQRAKLVRELADARTDLELERARTADLSERLVLERKTAEAVEKDRRKAAETEKTDLQNTDCEE